MTAAMGRLVSSRRHWAVALTVLALAAYALPALASESAERLYSRGLVEFHRDHFEAARDLFAQAVQADPNDAHALFYLGVAKARLGDLDGAIADLQSAVARDPNLPEAQLELGIALVQAQRNLEAVPYLEHAQSTPTNAARASLFLGIARLRLGDLNGARSALRPALEDPSLQFPARYYDGLAAYRQHQWADAEQQLTLVADRSPETDMGREAAQIVAQLRERRRNWRLYGAFAFLYDSNVILAPNDTNFDTVLGISRQGDGGVILTAGGIYTPWRTDNIEFSVGYEFYQSLYFHLDEFNLQDHRPSAQITATAGPFRLGLYSRYDYYLLSVDSFMQEVDALPFITLPEGEFGRTEAFYRFRWRDFFQSIFASPLDGTNNSGGIRQVFYLPLWEAEANIGYRFDQEEPTNSQGEVFAYNGNEVSTGLAATLPAEVQAAMSFTYRHENYNAASAGPPPSTLPVREDNRYQFIIGGRRQMVEHLALTAQYLLQIDDSNQALFSYNRNVGVIGVELWF